MTVERLPLPAVDDDERPLLAPVTLAGPATTNGTFSRQRCGGSHYADVDFRFEPLPPGSGIEFEDLTPPGGLAPTLLDGVRRGVAETSAYGLDEHEVTDYRATLLRARTWERGATHIAFAMAATYALRTAAEKAGLREL